MTQALRVIGGQPQQRSRLRRDFTAQYVDRGFSLDLPAGEAIDHLRGQPILPRR